MSAKCPQVVKAINFRSEIKKRMMKKAEGIILLLPESKLRLPLQFFKQPDPATWKGRRGKGGDS